MTLSMHLAFEMFSKALDLVLPKKEADPYLENFSYVSKKRFLIRTSYEGVGQSLKVDDFISLKVCSPLL